MHRHGSRSILVTDYQDEKFIDMQASVQRFRCPRCAATVGMETPEIEQGFKITKTASDMIVDTTLQNDIQTCSETSGVDKSTISRLLTSKADSILLSQPNLKTCRLQMLRPSLLAVLNQNTSEVVGYLPGISRYPVLSLLEKLNVETVIPCPETAPHTLPWQKIMTITLTGSDFAKIVRTLFKRSANKVVGLLKLPDSVTPAAATNLLGADLSTLSVADNITLAQIAPAGTPARGFMRLKDRLLAVHNAPDLTTARKLLTQWKDDCRDIWRTVFSNVLSFLDAYKDLILSNPYALQPAATYTGPSTLRPANIMTIHLHRGSSRYEGRFAFQR
jgi:hypothetical protein